MALKSNQYTTLVNSLPDPTTFKRLSSTLPTDPIEWVKHTRILEGKPFSFKEREYLFDIYKSLAQYTLVRKGRQTELTELLGNLMFFNAWRYPGTTGIYVSNTQRKSYKFSNRRVRDIILKYSPIIEKLAPLKNHMTTEITLINGSIIYFTSGHDNFKDIRMISGDFIYLDEIQDQNLREKANLTEAMSHSKYQRLIGVGTGSLEGSDWKKWFETGTNSEWNILKKKWTHKNTDAKVNSYHIPQTIVPWITQEQLDDKKNNMTNSEFEMEVMGNWVQGDEIPITPEMIEKLYHDFAFTLPQDVKREDGPIGITADWGGGTKSWTVLGAYQIIDMEKPIIKVLKLEPVLFPDIAAQAQKAISFIENYEPDFINVDAGGGLFQVQELEKHFGATRIWKTLYLGNTTNPYLLNDFNKSGLIKVDRTYSLEKTFDLIKRPHLSAGKPTARIMLPAQNRKDLEWLPEHLTSLYAVETLSSAGGKRVKYEKHLDKRSDALMNLNYLTIGLHVYKKKMQESDATVSVGSFGGSI